MMAPISSVDTVGRPIMAATALGFRDLGYRGNTPNIWDGVPAEVLQKHNLSYEAEWLSKCIDQSRRDIQAEWDDDMNLIS